MSLRLFSRAASARVEQLYKEHGREEVYLRPHEVGRELARYLDGVAISHHLAWPYTAVWHRTR